MAKRRYHPEFPTDLRAAVLHFDNISPALGQRFREVVRDKLATITECLKCRLVSPGKFGHPDSIGFHTWYYTR
jgi:hypothetical protein